MDVNPEIVAPTIMIIDDDPESPGVLRKMLAEDGFTVRSFPSGPPALRSAHLEPPDLILLDIRMPEMDGFEICNRLKADDTLKEIPVLFLSAIDETQEKVKAFEKGAADYITKPFQTEEILARVQTHLSTSELNRQLRSINQELEARVRDRTAELQQSNEFSQAVLMSMRAHIAALDKSGTILAVNDSWTNFARENQAASMERIGRGANYFDVCKRSSRAGSDDAQAAADGIKSVIAGRTDIFELEYACHSPTQQHWCLMTVVPLRTSKGGAVVAHRNITNRKLSEIKLQEAYQEITELKNQIEADKNYLQEEIRLEHNFDQIIGNSNEIKYALFRLEQVAKTDSTVIILGETGTGKELFSRALHDTSRRSKRPLIKIDCAALPAQLIESELFGHVRGAFTGADRSRQGRFELAHRGTLFLDEIGELPLALQTKLLRVLQDGEFERLGDNRTVKTDVRIIAATNRDITALVADGRFREDLWYRLNVFPITLPPLRDRKTDIPLLVNHFVRRIGKRVGKEISRIPDSVMEELVAYDWPGNVRELRHVLERSIIVSNGGSLSLHEQLVPSSKQPPSQKSLSHAEMERNHILRVLKQTRWVIEGPKGAARILKLHPNTLRYRMKKHGIRRPE